MFKEDSKATGNDRFPTVFRPNVALRQNLVLRGLLEELQKHRQSGIGGIFKLSHNKTINTAMHLHCDKFVCPSTGASFLMYGAVRFHLLDTFAQGLYQRLSKSHYQVAGLCCPRSVLRVTRSRLFVASSDPRFSSPHPLTHIN